jgi:hypothetical protein
MDFAAEFDQAQFLDGHGRGAELLFHQSDGAAHTIGGYTILGDALYGAQGYEIAEAVKSLAPAGFGPHQAQAFPIAKTVRLKTQDAPNFISRISLRQSARPLALPVLAANDYAPRVNSCLWYSAVHNLARNGAGEGPKRK